MVTGNIRPSLFTIGASFRSLERRSPSSVADMRRILSGWLSSLRSSRPLRQSTKAKSASSVRRWYSSKMTIPTPSRAGSSCKRRDRMPSVTTSTRVFGPTLLSKRIRYPMVSPTLSPNSLARRSAAARAARRLGSSIKMVWVPSHASFNSARGTRVVLPAPGGASRTASFRSANAERRAGRATSIGRKLILILQCTRRADRDDHAYQSEWLLSCEMLGGLIATHINTIGAK